ncbi:MAG TPA: hypothetical protein VMD02_01425 [Candidatus Omnitrophota bacterium]|nr:hypothetical protein [Candidatus Omnitrophota bacterium]
MGIEGLGGMKGAQGMSGIAAAANPPKGFQQIDSTGVWRDTILNSKDHFDGWAAGKKSEDQINKMLKQHPDGKEFEVVPGSVKQTANGTTFELRMPNPFK